MSEPRQTNDRRHAETGGPRTRVRIAIVDDHPLVREGLAALISAQPDMEVCGDAADVAEALELLRATKPALMVVDLALRRSHGLGLIEKIKKSDADTKVLVISAYEDSLFAERALRAGALGYINKQEAQEKIIAAIRTVLRGDRYLSAAMMQRFVQQTIDGERQGVAGLSNRELEIFELIGRGRSTRAIAEELKLSIHTIESHRENIRAKLDLTSGTELVQRAVRWVLETR